MPQTSIPDHVEAAPVQKSRRTFRHADGGLDWFRIIATIALIIQGGILFLALFKPGLPYSMVNPRIDALDSERFFWTLAATTNAQVGEVASLEVLTNGANYYPAELAAIRSAQKSITMESFINEPGEVQNQFFDALSDRARAGVKINVTTDAVGSMSLSEKDVDPIRKAGAHFAWYMPLRWYTWDRINHRNHRNILVVDGKVGFIGGSGWADHWLKHGSDGELPWRDTMVRLEGPIVTDLQAAFSENWLEASGEVLNGEAFFQLQPQPELPKGMVIRSSPTYGGSSTSRVLFQTLIAAAKERIHITTPYFLPDDSIQDELVRAIRERGVTVKVITPGSETDQELTRSSSRRLFGKLLEAGGQIYEYQGRMIHAKVLLVDDLWFVVGSTNIDPRSFYLNDEVNLAMPDTQVAARLEKDFQEDLKNSKQVDYEEWRNRGILERLHELFGRLIQRQQ